MRQKSRHVMGLELQPEALQKAIGKASSAAGTSARDAQALLLQQARD
jgi:hypothetical protein